MNTQEKDKTYIAGTYCRADVTFVKGDGSLLYDDNGREYIDFSSGIAVCGLGHCNKEWLRAVSAQASSLEHVSNLYYTEPAAELARQLCLRTGMKKVFFCNSGTEANECAIKCARKYARSKREIESPEIITLKNSFHGRTLAALSATAQDNLHPDFFAPYPVGFKYTEAMNREDFERVVTPNTAAVMLELIQGEGGVIALESDYVKAVCDYCKAEDILVIIDEVQTGNGRTGSLYAYMRYGIHPDIVTTAKGLGNGLPIGAVMFADKTENILSYGEHGSTFGANPIAAAGALAVLNQIDDALLKDVEIKSLKIKEALKNCGQVKAITGAGLMLGIETDGAKAKAEQCLDKGLVVLTAHDKLRLLPPLNIPAEQLEMGLKILKEVLK